METFQISGAWKIRDQETETPEKQTRDYFEEFHTVILSTAEQKCKGITEGHEVLDLGAGHASSKPPISVCDDYDQKQLSFCQGR